MAMGLFYNHGKGEFKMLKAIENFAKDCGRIGSFYAHQTLPRYLHPVAVPLLSVTVGPVLKGVAAYNDFQYFKKNDALVKENSEIGPIELSIREIFGETSIEGYQAGFDGIEMNFNQASLVTITPEGGAINLGNRGMSSFGEDRETCAQDLVGNFAAYPNVNGAAADDYTRRSEYYIAVRKAPSLQSCFYKAVETASPDQDVAAGAVLTATHRDPRQGEDTRKHYAIVPVDEATHQRLIDLGM